MRRLLLTCGSLLGLIAAPAAWAGDLTVTLTGVSSDPGTLYVDVWSSADTFRDEEQVTARKVAPATPGEVQVQFPDLPPGTYALMAFHDADGDGEMDRFLGMIPTEGYALSNDPEVSGPPAFDDSAFTVGEDATQISVTVRY